MSCARLNASQLTLHGMLPIPIYSHTRSFSLRWRNQIYWILTFTVPVIAGLFLFVRGINPQGEGSVFDIARGERIYVEACAACHGAALEGQPNWRSRGPDGKLPAPPHDASGHTWHHSDRVLLEITSRGMAAVVGGGYESNMPGFGDVYSEAELQDVLEWIKTQWPERERNYQARITAQDQDAR